ncbi:alpha/beta hydrolase [Algiphilus aromaticivorans]|jgi:pimeloyl-ACP methyl ester carboxylesterase|uniref:alpha/beta hydrolase n=1 Tax=Algiphilus aromaticivorans TaxID=382454 RepID=UPI000694224F|nr:alpha/beta fold hydrolase [Algiphilus aromaticivorans]
MTRASTSPPSPPWTLQLLRASIAVGGQIAPSLTARRLARLFFRPRRTRSTARELPAPDRERTAGGAYLRRWESGPRSVMLLHGWEGHYTQFEALIARLLEAGYTVIAVDPPAHGDAPGSVSHPGRFSDALRDAVAAEDAPYAVIGHSMGAGAALLAAKTGVRLPRMVLIASPASFRYVVDGFLDFVGLQGRGRERFRTLVEREVGHPLDAIEAAELAPAMGDTPVLLVHDRFDRRIPYEHAQRLRAGLSRAQLHETRGLGHQRLLADAGVIARVLEFLDQHATNPHHCAASPRQPETNHVAS